MDGTQNPMELDAEGRCGRRTWAGRRGSSERYGDGHFLSGCRGRPAAGDAPGDEMHGARYLLLRQQQISRRDRRQRHAGAPAPPGTTGPRARPSAISAFRSRPPAAVPRRSISEAAKSIAGESKDGFGPSSVFILNPGAEVSDAMSGASGADYMYMWTQILEGAAATARISTFSISPGRRIFRGISCGRRRRQEQPTRRKSRRKIATRSTIISASSTTSSTGAWRAMTPSGRPSKQDRSQNRAFANITTACGASVAFSLGSH